MKWDGDKLLRIFVGYDSEEKVAYSACCQSILNHASIPVSFIPTGLQNVPSNFKRPRGEKDSTEFAITRFLVPHFSGFEGYSVFVDCDVIFTEDIANLIEGVDEEKTISVVKHSYNPKNETKFLGNKQYSYTKKNWSSVMVFNNSKCSKLTCEYVQHAHGLDLHQFKWLEESEIGEVNNRWNFLVGEYEVGALPAVIHYTNGGPYFKGFEKQDYSSEWFQTFDDMLTPLSRKIIE